VVLDQIHLSGADQDVVAGPAAEHPDGSLHLLRLVGGEVHHRVEPAAGERRIEGVGAPVGAEALHPRAQPIRSHAAVEHRHPVATRHQVEGEIVADEAGAADEEDVGHGWG
jgi:hypothetical protein